jgi:hypothetical protein
MEAFPSARKDKLASQRSATKILTAFHRRIIVREGVIGNFTGDFHLPVSSDRAWISSSISILTQECKESKNQHFCGMV